VPCPDCTCPAWLASTATDGEIRWFGAPVHCGLQLAERVVRQAAEGAPLTRRWLGPQIPKLQKRAPPLWLLQASRRTTRRVLKDAQVVLALIHYATTDDTTLLTVFSDLDKIVTPKGVKLVPDVFRAVGVRIERPAPLAQPLDRFGPPDPSAGR
jgi:hypothetical protein